MAQQTNEKDEAMMNTYDAEMAAAITARINASKAAGEAKFHVIVRFANGDGTEGAINTVEEPGLFELQTAIGTGDPQRPVMRDVIMLTRVSDIRTLVVPNDARIAVPHLSSILPFTK